MSGALFEGVELCLCCRESWLVDWQRNEKQIAPLPGSNNFALLLVMTEAWTSTASVERPFQAYLPYASLDLSQALTHSMLPFVPLFDALPI